ncbi:MAG: M50 family metallopeptidase [Proteobacteria bacterium]|nr:M50 family metallopeptidase [Pseudomonadota bacterium]
MKSLLEKERRLLIAIVVLLILANVPYGRLVLYPFSLFSTWVHEMSHGIAALLLGGEIEWIKVYPDTSGLARTRRPDNAFATAFVASAGYVGTAIVGALMLAARRIEKVGQMGTAAFGGLMLLSVLLWVRNPFGFAALLVIGGLLVAAGLKLKGETAAGLYAFLAAACSLNAFTNIKDLLGRGTMQVGGQVVTHSDANTVAEALLLPAWFWAGSWLVLAVVLTGVGLRVGHTKT